MTKSSKPFIFDNYNVKPYFAGNTSLTRSPLAQFHNKVVKGLNKEDSLPKYVIFLPDKDLIEAAEQVGFGCKVVFEKVLYWLGENLDRALNLRKEDLRVVCSGALPAQDEPLLVWVKMFTRPFISNTNKGFVFAQCNTFNKMLDTVMGKFSNCRTLQLQLPENRDAFDCSGNLSPVGKLDFCRELNRQVRRMDREIEEARR